MYLPDLIQKVLSGNFYVTNALFDKLLILQ